MTTHGLIIESLSRRRRNEARKANVKENKEIVRVPQIFMDSVKKRKWTNVFEGKKPKQQRQVSAKASQSHVNERAGDLLHTDDIAIIAYADGDRYVGEVRDFGGNHGKMPDGYGTMTATNGDLYNGEWKCGKQNGFGIYIWADGTGFFGMWQNGLRHGEGTLHADGQVYHGMWEFGKNIKIIDDAICESKPLAMKHYQSMRQRASSGLVRG